MNNENMLYHVLLKSLSVDGFLACFNFLAIMNNASLNICVRFLCGHNVYNFLGYVPRNGIAGLCGISMFNLSRNCQSTLEDLA